MIRNLIVGVVAAAAVAATASAASAGGYGYGHGYGHKSYGYGYSKSHYKPVYRSCEKVFVGYKTKAIYEYGYVRYIEVPIYKKVCYDNGYNNY